MNAHQLQRPSTSPIELARRAVAGNSNATRRLLNSIAPGISGAVRSVLGANHPDLDDAIQLSLLAFYRALPAYRGEADPMGYARAIAVRTAILTRKRDRTHRGRRDGESEPDEFASEAPSPSDDADGTERQRLVRDLLTELPMEQAETLALRVGLGLSMEEVARATSAPVNTVRSRMRLAKERLRARIESDPDLRDAFDRPDTT